jgi:hypothetical protein
MRRIVIAASLLLAVACSAPPGIPQPSRATASHSVTHDHACADRVAQALSSPHVAVAGSFACLTPDQQSMASQYGITSDAGFQQVAASDPAMTSYRLLGQTRAGSFVYELDGPTADQLITLTPDASGKIAVVSGMQPEPVGKQ